MLAMVEIKTEDIEFAEAILLPDGAHFDKERRDFIRHTETIDLQAVPGSGKTTALLAKLIALGRYCPLSQKRGILVLSHTNAAVNEIRERIGSHCPHLFKPPHFIGTIQSFVDQFLCIPGFIERYKYRPNHIDNDLYRRYHERAKIDKTHLSARPKSIDKLYFNARLTDKNELICGKGEPYENAIGKTKDTYQKVLALKKRLRRDGVLAFDEAYPIGQKFLKDHPSIIRILRRRFKFIFVDEMQDMDSTQQGIIDDIFFCKDCALQRIGDKNQRIYIDDHESEWVDRKVVLTLTGSHRLTTQTATCVNRFQCYGTGSYSISGLRGEGLKPIIFTHTPEQTSEVLVLVSCHLRGMLDSGQLHLSSAYSIKAICWKKEHEKHNALTDYFSTYDGNKATPYPFRTSISDYLGPCHEKDYTFQSRSRTILEFLVRLLRMKNVRRENNKYYSVGSLRSSLKEQPESIYLAFKRFLFDATRLLLRRNHVDAIDVTKAYLPHFLAVFDKDMSNLGNFLKSGNQAAASAEALPSPSNQEKVNILNHHDFEMEVATVHSVKGQSHDVTIYLESFVSKYESEKVGNQISGIPLTNKERKGKQKMAALKMLYVGLSRPTQLACYVIDRERFDKHLRNDLDVQNWIIVPLEANDDDKTGTHVAPPASPIAPFY